MTTRRIGSSKHQVRLTFWSCLLALGVVSLLAATPQDSEETSAAPENPSNPAAADVADNATAEEAQGAEPASERKGEVVVVSVDSIIQTVVNEFLQETLNEADEREASLFVVELSTPGGVLQDTREIASAMLEADTPTVVYVSPSGSQAASAGFFILLAADIAAMAPSTNTGAAHPVSGQGGDIEGDLGEKVEQDASAFIRSLADRNARSLEHAESAVLESRAFSESEALELGLIDVVAKSLEDLLEQLHGRELKRPDGETVTLETRGVSVRRESMSGFQRFRSFLADPNLAVLLMSLGGLGLTLELYNPGGIIPGAVGAICLVLGLYGTSVLPVSSAGLALLLLALVFFAVEIKVQSMGFLTGAGAISLALGATMLFRSPDPAVRVSVQLIVAMVLVSVVAVIFMSVLAVRIFRSKVATGAEGLEGATGVVSKAISSATGKIKVHGEIWNARASQPIDEGAMVRVLKVDGLTLEVEPADSRG